MKKLSSRLFVLVWVALIVVLSVISFQYRSRTEALVAVVESQVTAVSYHKPVTIMDINVISGQEIQKGDTLLVVSRPDLDLDIERKTNELGDKHSDKSRSQQNHSSKIELLSLERDGKINRLTAELNELEAKMNQQRLIRRQLERSKSVNNDDSLKIIEIAAIRAEILDLKAYFQKEIQRQQIQLRQDTSAINQSMDLVRKELDALYSERKSLIKVASMDGIVGTVDAQLDELVPPYKTILSIYESQPSLIKAFKNELIAAPVIPGDTVRIVSENRNYSILGVVQELGARITNYPTKIQPLNSSTLNYGQEIFISIPKNNRFLNGEKVYVYSNLNTQ